MLTNLWKIRKLNETFDLDFIQETQVFLVQTSINVKNEQVPKIFYTNKDPKHLNESN